MITFFACLVLLLVGFFTYGKLVEKVFRIDDRPTPAVAHPDGVDFVPMKTWRIFLIQLLNIAGLGPIYGALAGACWGPVVYLWIVFGTILGGGVHDFLSGMMSERHDGASISEIVGMYLGKVMKFVMRIFSVVLLVMVGVNFSVGPARLISQLISESFGASLPPMVLSTTFWLVLVLLYYLLATFLPVDKIIGKVYPFFGICLIIMAVGIAGMLILKPEYSMPELWESMGIVHPEGLPKWAMMFVTVACGAISGFHATQSPMMARCMTSEKEGRTVFYGAMVSEGVIALIWAAAGVTFYNGVGALDAAISAMGQGGVVYQISTTLMGSVGGVLAMIGVIACPITSGDTAFRSARLVSHRPVQRGQARRPVRPPAGCGRIHRHQPGFQCPLAVFLLVQPDAGHAGAVGRSGIPAQIRLPGDVQPDGRAASHLYVSRLGYVHPSGGGGLPALHLHRLSGGARVCRAVSGHLCLAYPDCPQGRRA